MAFTRAPYGTIQATTLLIRDATINASAENNVAPGAASIKTIVVDNSLNPTQRVHLKLYNSVAPTVGTTTPEIILPVAGGTIMECVVVGTSGVLPTFAPGGVTFTTAVSVACVEEPGTAGTTPPTNATSLAMTLTT